MSYEEYVSLSEEEQLRYAVSEVENTLSDAAAVLDADGNWVELPKPEAEQHRAVGFGEDPTGRDFD